MEREDVMKVLSESIIRGVKEAIEALEEKDPNMDVNTTKIGSVDEYFKGNPVTDLVEAQIEYIQGADSEKDELLKRVSEAAKRVEEHQVNNTPETVESFVHNIVGELSFGDYQDEYKEQFEKELLQAVHTIQDTPGIAHFFVNVDGETKTGNLSVSGNQVIVMLDGNEYVHNSETNEPACTGNPVTCTRPYCECEEDFEDGMNLYNYVESLDEEYYEEVQDVMADIEEEIGDKKSFTGHDLNLIRFYLKHLPDNSDNEIDSLSDKAVGLAWKRLMYFKNSK